MKPNCISCNIELEMTEVRYREQGNYCKGCGSAAGRRAELRGKIGTKLHLIIRLKEERFLDIDALYRANAELENLRDDLEDEIRNCPNYTEVPIEQTSHPYGDRKPREVEEVDEFEE